jgi:hypothetical protein
VHLALPFEESSTTQIESGTHVVSLLPGPNRQARQARLSPLALLDELTMAAKLNFWTPNFDNRQSWAPVAGRYQKAVNLMDTQYGPLAASTVIPRPSNQAENLAKLDNVRQKPGQTARKCLIVIGAVHRITERSADRDTYIEFDSLRRQFSVSNVLRHAAMRDVNYRAFQRALQRVGRRDSTTRIIAIGRAVVEVDGTTRLIDLSFQVVSRDWIPVHSEYENDAVNLAVDQRRNFEKPLRPKPGEVYVSDLIFHDTGMDSRYEILGSDEEDYLRSAEDKIESLRKNPQIEVEVWRAYKNEPMKPFPQTLGDRQLQHRESAFS